MAHRPQPQRSIGKGLAAPRRETAQHEGRRLGFEPLEDRQLLAGTTIGVHAAGSTGTEALQLQVDGVTVASWTTSRVLTSARVFDVFQYTHPTEVTADRIRVAFSNDGRTASGADRNLFVDGITIDGWKWETEASSVYSTGTWSATTNGRLPGYRASEALHYNGYFQFGDRGSTIDVRAAGRTGEERMSLQVAGQTVSAYTVGGNYAAGQFVTFSYAHPTAVSLNQIRVVYENDGLTAAGVDRNLRVDAVILDGVRNETEAPTTISTGTYVAPQGRTIGKLQTEYLHLNGYFEYGIGGSVIQIRAAGRTGQEQMQLAIDGQARATFTNVGGNYAAGQFQTFVYGHHSAASSSQVRVAFTNDAVIGGVDRNLRVDGVTIDGVVYQSEAADVLSTGTYIDGVGIAPGLWQSEYLHGNGYLQFSSTAQPGVLALGSALISVNENAGSVAIPVVRTGGSDTTVGLRYTTVDAAARAGSDYSARSGLIVFGPGETSKTIVVPIIDDSLDEANEAFNLAVDQSIGGATTGVPRTATITIVDDDGGPAPGNGNGLLGLYFDDIAFGQQVMERTDSTIDFTWPGAPVPSMGADTFSVRWIGQVEPLYTETYAFRTTSDDGVRLWVNNQLIIDQWNDHGATDHTGTIALAAGQKYSIRMEFYENGGSAVARLAWSSPRQALQVIPQSQLYSDPPSPLPTGTFSAQTVVSGLSGPVAVDFDSSGRMFIAEQRGVVRVYQNGQLRPTPFLDIQTQVNFIQDRGLLGIAVHPNFPATPFVYVAYTYDPPETASHTGNAGRDGGGNRVARVTRFTADSASGYNTAVAGSEVVLVGTNSTWANISHPELDSTNDITLLPSGGQNGRLRDILIADSRSHTVGNLAFGPDGMLYVANGDGTSYGRVDPRTERVQSVDSLSGKILRVDPITGAGLSDNPFYNGDPGANRSKVLNYGLRNPFRFAFQPASGQLFIGDVGWNTWEEINVGRGENFGWPWYEGGSGVSEQTGGYRDLAAAQAFYASNPDVEAPLWARTHASGAAAIVVGDFYTGSTYPAPYANSLFITDVGDPQFRLVRLNSDGSLHSTTPLGLSAGPVVEMTMGRDGFMYFVDISGRVGRLVFTPAAAMAPASSVVVVDSGLKGEMRNARATAQKESTLYEPSVLVVQQPSPRTQYRPAARATLPSLASTNAPASARDLALEAFVLDDPFEWRQKLTGHRR